MHISERRAARFGCPVRWVARVGECFSRGFSRQRSGMAEWIFVFCFLFRALSIDAQNVSTRNEDDEIGDAARIVWNDQRESGSTSRPRGCGTTSKSRGRLVGARPADPAEWPWMAALLRRDRSHYCGGVLVTDRHVLTAAHCVHSATRRDLAVRLGEYDFATTDETRTSDFAVSEIRVHRDFDPTTYANDVAMIEMHRPTAFDDRVWPVCLPPIGESFENESAVIIGWGTTSYGGPVSTVLMEVGVPIWPQHECVRSFVRRIPDTTMCAGAREGGRDACQGDSGGPLLLRLGNGRWATVGIVSWGIRCGEPGHPGLYTRVASYLDWILENAEF